MSAKVVDNDRDWYATDLEYGTKSCNNYFVGCCLECGAKQWVYEDPDSAEGSEYPSRWQCEGDNNQWRDRLEENNCDFVGIASGYKITPLCPQGRAL